MKDHSYREDTKWEQPAKGNAKKNGLVELIKVRNNMAKSYYIVTMNAYIGHDPFDEKNVSERDKRGKR